ncbi:hypothetical protein [Psychromonas sp. MME2]|uniref:LPP20 family lipoprotein n=1 Tax=unclassified Psychromonas TaxID=2614957 RepID=UPI00339C3649
MSHGINRFISSLLMVVAILLLSACAKTNGQQQNMLFSSNDQPYIMTSIGYAPIAAQQGESFDLQMLNAIKASKLEAYKELAEQIYGVLLSSENAVNGSRLLNDLIQAQVNGLVRGAKVLKSYHEGDLYITELALDMRSVSLLKESGISYSKQEPAVNVEQQVFY